MVPRAEFWQTCRAMQNASEAGAGSPLSAAVPDHSPTSSDPSAHGAVPAAPPEARPREREIGGPTGPEPTRYGDWEKKGRCIDF